MGYGYSNMGSSALLEDAVKRQQESREFERQKFLINDERKYNEEQERIAKAREAYAKMIAELEQRHGGQLYNEQKYGLGSRIVDAFGGKSAYKKRYEDRLAAEQLASMIYGVDAGDFDPNAMDRKLPNYTNSNNYVYGNDFSTTNPRIEKDKYQNAYKLPEGARREYYDNSPQIDFENFNPQSNATEMMPSAYDNIPQKPKSEGREPNERMYVPDEYRYKNEDGSVRPDVYRNANPRTRNGKVLKRRKGETTEEYNYRVLSTKAFQGKRGD